MAVDRLPQNIAHNKISKSHFIWEVKILGEQSNLEPHSSKFLTVRNPTFRR